MKQCWRLLTYFTDKIIHVIFSRVFSFSVSVKTMNHKIHMNFCNELLKEIFLLNLKKWTETFCLFKSGEKLFAFIWLKWNNVEDYSHTLQTKSYMLYFHVSLHLVFLLKRWTTRFTMKPITICLYFKFCTIIKHRLDQDTLQQDCSGSATL